MYFDFYVAAQWAYLPALSVRTIYKLYTDPSYVIRHRIIDREKYVFFYTVAGEGEIEVDGRVFRAAGNSLLLANSRVSLSYSCRAPRWDFWLVECKSTAPPVPVNSLHTAPFSPHYSQLLEAALENLKRDNPLAAAAHFQLLCCELRDCIGSQKKQQNLLLQKCISYMTDNLRGFAVADLCESLHISSRTLDNLFRSLAHVPPYRYYQWLRVDRAKVLLETGDSGITQIASQLGFSSTGHFCRVFRQQTGRTPKQYRTEFRTSY